MRKTSLVAGALAIGLIATGCGGKRNEAPSAQGGSTSQQACETSDGRITIATGNTGGVYYTLGGGLAQLISSNTKLRATAAETTASVQNIQQLVKGDYDVAFSLADTAADAVNGKGSFESPQKITALARIYSNSTHVVVRTDSGIKTVDGMKSGQIDGLVWSGGLPTPEITDLTTSMKAGVTFLDITGQLDAMKK